MARGFFSLSNKDMCVIPILKTNKIPNYWRKCLFGWKCLQYSSQRSWPRIRRCNKSFSLYKQHLLKSVKLESFLVSCYLFNTFHFLINTSPVLICAWNIDVFQKSFIVRREYLWFSKYIPISNIIKSNFCCEFTKF